MNVEFVETETKTIKTKKSLTLEEVVKEVIYKVGGRLSNYTITDEEPTLNVDENWGGDDVTINIEKGSEMDFDEIGEELTKSVIESFTKTYSHEEHDETESEDEEQGEPELID